MMLLFFSTSYKELNIRLTAKSFVVFSGKRDFPLSPLSLRGLVVYRCGGGGSGIRKEERGEGRLLPQMATHIFSPSFLYPLFWQRATKLPLFLTPLPLPLHSN